VTLDIVSEAQPQWWLVRTLHKRLSLLLSHRHSRSLQEYE
jgi:hypothetical protein